MTLRIPWRQAARCQELVTTKLVPLLLQAEKGQLQVHPQSQAAAQQQQRHAQQQQAAAQITQVAQQQQMAQKMQAILPQLQQVVGMPPMLPGLPGSPGLPGMPPGMPAHNVVQQMQGPRVQEELQRQHFLQRQLRVQQLARQAAERRQAKEDAERQDLEDDGVIVNNSYDATSSALLEQEELEEDEAQAKEVVFAHYAPRKVVYGNLHRDALVESSVMASIEPPDPTHVPSLPESLLYGERGRVTFSRGAVWQAHEPNALSAAQLEAVVYAGQRHAQHNGDGTRCGFFIGDGTGVGKGREIGAVILDNMRRGRLRHIWCSVSTTLLLDCKRDLEDLGRKDIELCAPRSVRTRAPRRQPSRRFPPAACLPQVPAAQAAVRRSARGHRGRHHVLHVRLAHREEQVGPVAPRPADRVDLRGLGVRLPARLRGMSGVRRGAPRQGWPPLPGMHPRPSPPTTATAGSAPAHARCGALAEPRVAR